MIVPLNSDKYKSLFARANEFLDLTDTDPIQTLNHYYAHMKDFWLAKIEENGELIDDKRKYQFIMMPLSEEGEDNFEINLNTREIKVPDAFKKIGAVESDQMAEMFVFNCDRFYDHMDLSSTNIYVQWELPVKDEDGNAIKKATPITIIDLESVPGKIRFAWPLHNEITQAPGVVKFSVRFFNLNEDGKTLNYSLNTLDAQVTVKSVLNRLETPDSIDVNGLFEQAIKNSSNVAAGMQRPSLPSFGSPGLNISEEAFEDENNYLGTAIEDNMKIIIAKLNNNELKVRVQAYIQDNGELSYDWYYTQDKDSETVKIDAGTEYVEVDYTDPKIKFNYNETYYIADEKDSEGDIISYKKYTGLSFPAPSTSENDKIELFEKFSTLTIEWIEGEIVTGEYQVVATNTVGDMKNITYSIKFRLPAPEDIKFNEKLYTVKNNIIEVNYEQPKFVDELTEVWGFKIAEAGTYNGTTDFTKVGYYLPTITQKLNGTTKNNSPENPYIKYASGDQLKATVTVTSYTENNDIIEGDSSIDYSPNYYLKATVEFTDPNEEGTTDIKLYQNYKYKWYRQYLDSSSSENKVILEGKDQNILFNNFIDNKKSANYWCVIENNPAGEIVSSESKPISIIIK